MAISSPGILPVGTLVSYGFYEQLFFAGLTADGKHAILFDPAGERKEVEIGLFIHCANILSDQVYSNTSHQWDDSGERCVLCGDKDWYADDVCSRSRVVQPQAATIASVNSKLDFAIEQIRNLTIELKSLREIVDARGREHGLFQRGGMTYEPNRCLACGQTHIGNNGLPCPNMRAT